MPILTLTNDNGSFDISKIVDTITWSGEYRSCARTLDFGMVSSPDDSRVPEIDCSVGSSVVMEADGEVVFNGFIFDRTKSTTGLTIDISCVDRGIYLNQNRTSKKWTASPEAATRSLCREFGINVGALADTGVTVQRKFFAASLYEMIVTLYTQAAKTTGEAYHIGFVGDKLTVRAKGAGGCVLLLKGGSNIMSAAIAESGKSIVNQVVVEDKDGNITYTVNDDKSIAAYGLMQQVIRQSGSDPMGDAKKMITAGGISQHITVENLGDLRCITGNAIMLEESYTGLYGLFFIDSDTHTWKNGLYFNKLTLNLKAVMDEKSAGELLDMTKTGQAAKIQIKQSQDDETRNFRVDRIKDRM